MKNQAINHYNALKLLSYNGIYNFIVTNRNYGKTWAFKRRAWRRAIKHGKKTLWLRTFKKEVKEASSKFYASRDLQKYCGIVPFDKKTGKGNFKRIGNTFYYKKGNAWVWFLQICTVGDSNAMRSADDVDTDTIVYDEFTMTVERYKRYRGNVVNDFIDLFISAKREHQVRCFFLGNKESVSNPFYNYFGIPTLPLHFEGIKTYRQGSIVVQQIDNKPKNTNDYDKKVTALLQGTSYGNYLYEGTYKNQLALKTRKPPVNAVEYIQLCINGYEIKISVYNGFFYVSNTIDVKRRVYTLKPLHKYKNELLLVKRQKRLFVTFINALADARVYYNSQATYEAIQDFYTWLNV